MMDLSGSILIGDSRVSMLKSYLGRDMDLSLQVNSYSGATIENLKSTAEYIAKHHHYQYIYLFGGVNDLTTKDYATRKVSSNFTDVDMIHTTIMGRYTDCFKAIKSVNESVIVIFIPLIGLDLEVYNNRPRCKLGTGAYLTAWKEGILEHPDQSIINDGIVATNETLIALNATQGKSTPLINHSIHRRNRAHSPYRHLYYKLEDGLHPHDTTAQAWSNVISKIVQKNSV